MYEDLLSDFISMSVLFGVVYGTAIARIGHMTPRPMRGTSAGRKKRFHVSTAQAFSGDGCDMRAGTEGRGGYWLMEQVPVAHVGATQKQHISIYEPVFKDLSYYDKFAPRTVGTYDWARMG